MQNHWDHFLERKKRKRKKKKKKEKKKKKKKKTNVLNNAVTDHLPVGFAVGRADTGHGSDFRLVLSLNFRPVHELWGQEALQEGPGRWCVVFSAKEMKKKADDSHLKMGKSSSFLSWLMRLVRSDCSLLWSAMTE